MKGYILTIIAFVFAIGLGAQVLTCHDVQYTTDPSGNTPYANQTITVQGIVTHIIPNSAFYIGDPEGGPWSGLYIYNRNTSNVVALGDMIKITGTVVEYYNLTEVSTVSSYEILSQGNPMPPAAELSTSQIAYGAASSEQWEGVLVRLTDVQVKSAIDSYGQFKVADTSNVQAMVDNGLYNFPVSSIVVGEWWYMIQGIVDYHSAAGYKINPRNANDMIKVDSVESSAIRIPNVNGVLNTVVDVPVTTSKIKSAWGVQSYTITFRIDPTKIHFQGLNIAGTLSPMQPVPTISAAGDTISFTVVYQEMLVAAEGDTLINLSLEPLVYGDATVDILSFKYDNVVINNLIDGSVLTKIVSNIAYLNIGNSTDSKNIFNPANNEKISITYGCKSGLLGKALVRIYDAQGRLVATPVNVNLPNASATLSMDTYEWNGRDANLNLLPPGLYYCHLEVQDRRTGKSERTVQPIVIKSRLK